MQKQTDEVIVPDFIVILFPPKAYGELSSVIGSLVLVSRLPSPSSLIIQFTLLYPALPSLTGLAVIIGLNTWLVVSNIFLPRSTIFISLFCSVILSK